MMGEPFDLGAATAHRHLEQLSRRAEDLPTAARALVAEILEAFSISVEELQVAAEELHQQNQELLAAREEMEIERRRYQDLFEFAPDGYLVTDPGGIIQEANQAAVRLLGAPKDQLMGKPMVLHVERGERDLFHVNLDRVVQRNKGVVHQVEWELRLQPRWGEAFPAALTVTAIRDPQNGEVTGLRWLVRDVTASKRAEERERLLAESREQRQAAEEAKRLLEALIQTMPVGAVITDGEGRVLTTNAAARTILGSGVRGTIESPQRSYTPHRPDGAPLPPDDMPLMQALREGRSIGDAEILIRRADGEERTILASAAPVRNQSGEIVSGVTIFQDITERKKAQVALGQYANRLRVVHEIDRTILAAGSRHEIAASALRYLADELGCVRASIVLFDLAKQELSVLAARGDPAPHLGEGWRGPMDPEWVWVLEELAQGKTHTVPDMQNAPTSSPIVETLQAAGVRAHTYVPLLVQGELIGSLNVGMATSDPLTAEQEEMSRELANEVAIGLHQARLQEELERHAEQLEGMVAQRTAALRMSEARFRTIFEDSVFGITFLDTEGRIVASNPALQQMLGYSDQELQGTRFSSYSHPDDAEADRDLHRELATGQLGYYQVDKRYVRRDGQARWSEQTLSLLKGLDEIQPGFTIAMVEDVTEKRMTQEALLRGERLAVAGHLGASLAHEINNPLQAVIGCLGLAEELVDKRADVHRYLEIAMEELERAAGIVTQLRDLSRETEGKKRELVDLNTLVEKTLVLTRKRCQDSGVEVVWSRTAGLPMIPAVADRLQQVFLNLALNAVEAMPQGGRLKMSTGLTELPKGVHARFEDNGKGIDPERLPGIFEPFRSTRPEGLGMGLYVSKKIVEEHGGHIEVDGRPGEGATFIVWLPR